MQRFSSIGRVLLATGVLALAGCGDSPLERVSPIGESNEARLRRLESETEAIQDLIQTYYAAYDAQDGRRMASLFAPSAEVFLHDGRVIKGEKLDRELNRLWSSWNGVQATWHTRGVNMKGPFAWAKYGEEIAYEAGGVTRTMNNLVTFAFEKRDDTWYISHLHISSATPPDA